MRYSMCIATSPCRKAPLGTKLNTDQQCANKLIQTSQMQFLLDIYRIRSIRRRGYYLVHRPSLCSVYSRVAFINISSCQRGNP